MSDVLRSTTFQLEFKGQDGITGVRQFTKAISDADETVEELSRVLGDNTVVTAKNIKTKKELVADGRRVVSQMERTKSKVRELTRFYNNQSQAVNRTTDEQEVLNAVYKLGANATDIQKNKIKELVQNYQKVRTETTKTSGSFRNLRGVTQNLGWQMQDVAVQAQMGTSAFVIFSQQGSQMASAFGPQGAVIGAFIAVIGVMAGVAASTDKAKESAKALKDAKLELIPVLQEQAKALKFLEAAQLRVLKAQDTKILKELNKQLKANEATIFSSGRNWNLTGKELKKHNKELDRNRAKQETLSNQIFEVQERMRGYNKNLKENSDSYKSNLKSINSTIEAYEKQARNIGLSDRAIAVNNAVKKKATALDYQRIAAAFDLIEAEELRIENEKLATSALTAKNKTAAKALADKTKKELSRHNSIVRMFESEAKSLIKQTESTEEEYSRRKIIIDNYVKEIGSTDNRSAQSYIELEKWKTLELSKEYNKREILRRQIEKAQVNQLVNKDSTNAENNLFTSNIKILNNQKKQLGEDELDEKKRIDQLLEQEVKRHRSKMEELEETGLKNTVAVFSMGSQQITSLADMMTSGVQQVEDATSEMNAGQKAAFVISQGIAAAMAVIEGITLGSRLAASLSVSPIDAASYVSFGTGLGVANASAIMATTFAGAFDKGGTIPSGQLGIVSEYGDELVNGQLVKGPAKVTSREDTAKMMNGGSSTKITIENKIEGASFRTQQIDENSVKIIAEQVFSNNIDNGVSGVLNNRNSKSTKAIKSKFNVRSQL